MKNNRLKYLREADKVFGDIICTLLAVHKFFKRKKILEQNKIKEILLIKFWGFGSILLMTPAIKALKNKYPHAKITILTLEENKELCTRIKLIDDIMVISIKTIIKALKDLIKVISIIRKKQFDIAIDFEFFVGVSAIITYLSSAHYKIGFKSDRVHSRNTLYNKPISYNKRKHITVNFGNLIKPIGISNLDYTLEKLKIFQKDRKYVSLLLKRAGFRNNHWLVCININAGELAFERRWPKEKFVKLAKKIIKRYPFANIMFIGSKKEKGYVESTLRSLGNRRIINLAGKLDIPQLQVLLEKTSLFITNDSGPMHLAAVVGTKSICLFGPESPVLYAPLNKNAIIMYKNLKCSPCMDIYNRKIIKCHSDAECMKKITVNEVFRKVKQILYKS